MSKILLVTLVHNRKHLVGAAIKSAMDQSLPKDKWAHLIIDNLSTDGAETVAKHFSDKNDNIEFVQMDENLGQQRAYNFVLDEWIPKNMPNVEIMAILDSDDLLKPNALSEVLKMFSEHPEIGQTYSGFDIIKKSGKVKHPNHAKAKLIPNQFTLEGQRTLRKVFIKANPIGHLRAFRVKCLKDIGGFNTKYQYATDYNIAGRMLMKYPVVKIDKVLYQWRQHDVQVERQHSPLQTKNWQDMQKEFRKLFIKKGLI